MTKPVNIALSSGAELFIGHKTGPVYPLDAPEGARLEVMDVGDKGLAKRSCLSTV